MKEDEISEEEVRRQCADNLRFLAHRMETGEVKITKFVHMRAYTRRPSLTDPNMDDFVAGKLRVLIEYE